MLKTVYINSDGTIDSYDEDNCKISFFSGELPIVHTILSCYNQCKNGSPSKLDNKQRTSQNIDFIFRISNTANDVKIPESHISKISNYIINNINVEDAPQPNN